MLKRLTDPLSFQTEALLLRSERQRVLASNIANADTPHYQARDMDFAQALRDATAGQSTLKREMTPPSTVTSTMAPPMTVLSGAPQQVSTAAGHLASPVEGSVAEIGTGTRRSEMGYATPAMTALDGNSVDMDRERAAFADNSIKYEATLRFINTGVRTMLDAIKGQ
jgi:flagellar basal-body rod protein FlgB